MLSFRARYTTERFVYREKEREDVIKEESEVGNKIMSTLPGKKELNHKQGEKN
jgi:hypothetical protein